MKSVHKYDAHTHVSVLQNVNIVKVTDVLHRALEQLKNVVDWKRGSL